MLTEKECKNALLELNAIKDIVYRYLTLLGEIAFDNGVEKFEKLIEEHFDNSANFKHFKLHSDSTLKGFKKDELVDYIHMVYHNWQGTDSAYENVVKMNYKLQSEVDELKKNPPLKFEEIKEGMWVWDDRCKKYTYIKNIDYKTGTFNGEKITIDDKSWRWYSYTIFEENRYFRYEVKE